MRLNSVTETVVAGRGQYHLVDLLRGLASILILVVHYKHFFQGADPIGPLTSINEVELFVLWKPLYEWGSNVVQLFWLISGFVFMHVYGGRTAESWRKFGIKRFARLYPLHALTLLLTLGLQTISLHYFNGYNIYQHNDLYHFILNLFLASEWGLQDGRSFNGPIWSVSVEIFSYIIFFALIKYLRATFLFISLAILSSAFLYKIFDGMVMLCLVYFWCGCFTYLLVRKGSAYTYTQTLFFYFSTLCVFTLLAIMFESIPRIAVYVPIFSSLVCIAATIEKVVSIQNGTKYFQWIGDTSYGNYLWHSPLQMLFLIFVSLELINDQVIYSKYFMPLYISFVTAVSLLSFRFFERPMQQYLRRISHRFS